MKTPDKDLSKEESATLLEMFDYLCCKIDFGHSFLDSTAVVCMNKLFIELRKQKEKISLS
jgi:hypothetical protein